LKVKHNRPPLREFWWALLVGLPLLIITFVIFVAGYVTDKLGLLPPEPAPDYESWDS
jgi:hypothetical protein